MPDNDYAQEERKHGRVVSFMVSPNGAETIYEDGWTLLDPAQGPPVWIEPDVIRVIDDGE